MFYCPPSNPDAHAPASPEGGRPSTILLVDDDERLSAILQNYLELNRFIVHAATTGEEALRVCVSHLPDVILMDVRMPGIGGLEALRRIREARVDVPVVIITYVDEESVRAQAATYGVKEYLLKPVNFEDVKALLHTLLQACNPPAGERPST